MRSSSAFLHLWQVQTLQIALNGAGASPCVVQTFLHLLQPSHHTHCVAMGMQCSLYLGMLKSFVIFCRRASNIQRYSALFQQAVQMRE